MIDFFLYLVLSDGMTQFSSFSIHCRFNADVLRIGGPGLLYFPCFYGQFEILSTRMIHLQVTLCPGVVGNSPVFLLILKN